MFDIYILSFKLILVCGLLYVIVGLVFLLCVAVLCMYYITVDYSLFFMKN